MSDSHIEPTKTLLSFNSFHKYVLKLSLGMLILSSSLGLINASGQSDSSVKFKKENIEMRNGMQNSKGDHAVLLRAWNLFEQAWEQGQWQPFIDMFDDQVVFWFPQGEFRGKFAGKEGKERLRAWAQFQQRSGARIDVKLLNAVYGANTAVFESESRGLNGLPYVNFETVVFEVRGEKISAMREYWFNLDPFTAR
jgi:ketosteroid isomerase-like protein